MILAKKFGILSKNIPRCVLKNRSLVDLDHGLRLFSDGDNLGDSIVQKNEMDPSLDKVRIFDYLEHGNLSMNSILGDIQEG